MAAEPGSIEQAKQRLRSLREREGEVEPETKPAQEEPKEEPQKEAKEEAAPEGLLEEPEKEAQEPEEEAKEPEPEKEAEPEKKAEEKEEEQELVESLSDLAEHLEVDPDFFHSLKVQAKVNDKPVETTVKELLDTYQIRTAAEERLAEAKRQSQALHQEREKAMSEVQTRLRQADEIVKEMEAQLEQEFSSVNWKELKQDDPGQYAAMKADLAERKAQLAERRSKVESELQNQQQEQLETQRQQAQQVLQQHNQALADLIPEWHDSDTAKQERSQLTGYLKEIGFGDDELGIDSQTMRGFLGLGIAADSRLIAMARKAMLFDKGTKKADIAKKKVKTLPKRVKPSSPKPQAQVEKQKLKDLRAKLKKSGTLEDAFALRKAMRNQ